MKILYLTNIPSPYRVDFFNELGKKCELTVLFERHHAGDRDNRWKSEIFTHFKTIFLQGRKVGVDASFCPGVVRYLTKDYDAIILGGYSSPTYMLAIDYMRIRKIPFLLNADGGFINKDKKIMHYLKRHFISRASGWLSTGEMTDRYLMHYGAAKSAIYHYPFTSMRKSDLYYPSSVEREKMKRELHIRERVMIISVGRFIPLKGFDFLIKAAGALAHDCGVYIIGGTPNQTDIENKEAFYATNVHFVDFMNKENLKKYYIAADIFVFPTLKDVWGLVLNEAMSYGLPCVSSIKANASFELIEDGSSGYLIEPQNTRDMIDKLELLINNQSLRISMGKKSYEKMKDFTIEKMADRHLEILGAWLKSVKGGS